MSDRYNSNIQYSDGTFLYLKCCFVPENQFFVLESNLLFVKDNCSISFPIGTPYFYDDDERFNIPEGFVAVFTDPVRPALTEGSLRWIWKERVSKNCVFEREVGIVCKTEDDGRFSSFSGRIEPARGCSDLVDVYKLDK